MGYNPYPGVSGSIYYMLLHCIFFITIGSITCIVYSICGFDANFLYCKFRAKPIVVARQGCICKAGCIRRP